LTLTLYNEKPCQGCDDAATNAEPDINQGADVRVAGSLPTEVNGKECYEPEDEI
jgi:hypothetical protein